MQRARKHRKRHVLPGPIGLRQQRQRTAAAVSSSSQSPSIDNASNATDNNNNNHSKKSNKKKKARSSLNVTNKMHDHEHVQIWDSMCISLHRILPSTTTTSTSSTSGSNTKNKHESISSTQMRKILSKEYTLLSDMPHLTSLKIPKIVLQISQVHAHGHCDYTVELLDESSYASSISVSTSVSASASTQSHFKEIGWLSQGLIQNHPEWIKPGTVFLCHDVSVAVFSMEDGGRVHCNSQSQSQLQSQIQEYDRMLVLGEQNIVYAWTKDSIGDVGHEQYLDLLERRSEVEDCFLRHTRDEGKHGNGDINCDDAGDDDRRHCIDERGSQNSLVQINLEEDDDVDMVVEGEQRDDGLDADGASQEDITEQHSSRQQSVANPYQNSNQQNTVINNNDDSGGIGREEDEWSKIPASSTMDNGVYRNEVTVVIDRGNVDALSNSRSVQSKSQAQSQSLSQLQNGRNGNRTAAANGTPSNGVFSPVVNAQASASNVRTSLSHQNSNASSIQRDTRDRAGRQTTIVAGQNRRLVHSAGESLLSTNDNGNVNANANGNNDGNMNVNVRHALSQGNSPIRPMAHLPSVANPYCTPSTGNRNASCIPVHYQHQGQPNSSNTTRFDLNENTTQQTPNQEQLQPSHRTTSIRNPYQSSHPLAGSRSSVVNPYATSSRGPSQVLAQMSTQAPSLQNRNEVSMPNQNNVTTIVTPNDQDKTNANGSSSNASSIASLPSTSTPTSDANSSTRQSNNTINNPYEQRRSNQDAALPRNPLVSESAYRTTEMMQPADNRTTMQTPSTLATQLSRPKCAPHHTPIVQRQSRDRNQSQSTGGAWQSQSQLQVNVSQTNHEKSIWNSVESHTVDMNVFVDDEENHAGPAVDDSAASASAAKSRASTYTSGDYKRQGDNEDSGQQGMASIFTNIDNLQDDEFDAFEEEDEDYKV